MKKIIASLIIIITITATLTDAYNVERISVTRYGIQIDYDDGTGYWLGR